MTAAAARRLFIALLTVLAALDLIVLTIRMSDVVSLGRLFLFPAEGPVLYAIWKVRNGHPLYEWPTRPYFVLTLYNFLFYKSYAGILAALRVTNDGMPIAGRFVTLAFAAFGALGQYTAARRVVWIPPSYRLPLALLSLVTWIGGALPGWWALSVRPDIPAAAISTWGVAAALAAFRQGLTPNTRHTGERCQSSPRGQTHSDQTISADLATQKTAKGVRPLLAAAGLAFAIAWGFKQSQVALFVATCVYVIVWRRSRSELLFLTVPFAAVAAIALDVGGAVYRANILDAARVNALIPYLSLYWYRSVILTSLLLWVFALQAVVALVRPGSAHGPLRSIADVPERSRLVFGADLTYPALATVLAGAAGAVLLAKVGSALNHILELNVAASLTCAAVLGAAWDTPRARSQCRLAAVTIVPMIAFAAALLQHDGGFLATALQLKSWGTRLHLTTARVVDDRRRLAESISALPHPLFTDDELFAQPWHATGNRYPAVMLDHVFYDAARSKGLVGRGVEGLFADRYFAAAVMPDSSAFLAPAMRAGYRLTRTIPQADGEPLRILVRDR
jgi:hypothetical protein